MPLTDPSLAASPPRVAVTSAPAKQAITVAEAKALAHIDGTTDDSVKLPMLIGAATELLEEYLRGPRFITQTVTIAYDASPTTLAFRLPVGPVQSISSVKTYAADGTSSTLDSGEYVLDASDPLRPQLVQADSLGGWPTGVRAYSPFVVTAVVGYGNNESDVPERVRLAVALTVKAWYDDELPQGQIPKGAMQLVQHLRGYALGGRG